MRLDENEWEGLIYNIAQGKCVPFIGPGACRGMKPSNLEIIEGYAHNLPLSDKRDLARVAQFLAMRSGEPDVVKSKVASALRMAQCPRSPNDAHTLLAGLPLSLYVTTNYDSLMMDALAAYPMRKPRREYCRWVDHLSRTPLLLRPEEVLIPAQPVVFHLFGHADKSESLVLTEDDYLNFLVNTARNDSWLPEPISDALSHSTMLLLGYKLTDWDFRVLACSMLRPYSKRDQPRRHISVQMVPGGLADTDAAKLQALLESLGGFMKTELRVSVFWGDCEDFVLELRSRLKQAGVTIEECVRNG